MTSWTYGSTITREDRMKTATEDQTLETMKSVYDKISADYDARYEYAEAYQENEHVRQLIEQVAPDNPYTLDVGCGTGLLLDLGITLPDRFVGIDPSRGMLWELMQKHPEAQRVIPHSLEQYLNNGNEETYELVTALFGVPSYIPYDALMQLPDLASKALVLMAYGEGYYPDIHEQDSPLAASSRQALLDLSELSGWESKLSQVGNFMTLVMYR